MTALGIERGIVVFWEHAGGEGYCTPDGYSIDIRGEDEGSWTTYTAGPDASSYTVLNLEPGRYRVRVRPHSPSDAGGFAGSSSNGTRAALGQVASASGNGGAMFNENAEPGDGVSGAADVNVPANCSITLTISSDNAGEISGSWTNAASEYGCEAGGVYIDYRKATQPTDLSHKGLARNSNHKVNGQSTHPGDTASEGNCNNLSADDVIQIISNSGTDNVYSRGDKIRICINFGKTVHVTGTPRLKYNLRNADTRWVNYESGSGSSKLIFSRVVDEQELSDGTNGISVVANSLQLNGGTINEETPEAWSSTFRVPNEDEGLNRFIFGDLDPEQPYEFRVRAIDARGIGKDSIDSSWMRESAEVTETTLARPTITGVTGIPGGVTVTWSDFAPAGVTVDGYKARFREKLGDDWTTTADADLIDADARSHDVTGMTFGKDYWVEVGAVTSTHELWSRSHEGSPSDDAVPDLPADPFMAWFTEGTPNRNWSNNRIFMVSDTSVTASAVCHITGDSIHCPPLTLVSLEVDTGSEHNARVRATAGGETAQSVAINITDTGYVREARASGGDGKMAVAWIQARHIISGKTLKSHVIKYEKTGAAAVWVQQAVDDTSHTITGLTNGDYKVWVYGCVNASSATTETRCMVLQGDGTYANEAGAELSGAGARMDVPLASGITGTPGMPRNLYMEQLKNNSGTAFINQMKVSWKRPLDDGGADMHRYRIRYTPTGGEAAFEDFVPVVPNAVFNKSHVHQIKDLTVGTTYSVAVQAINVNGEGVWSGEATITLQ